MHRGINVQYVRVSTVASIYGESGYGEQYDVHDVSACKSQKKSLMLAHCIFLPKCTVGHPPRASKLNTNVCLRVCVLSQFSSHCFQSRIKS